MLSARGFKAGAGASFNFNKNFGPVGIGFGVSVDLGAFVSFTPIQIGGFIQLGGYAYLKFFFFKLGLSVQIGLAAEAPHPFSLIGTLKLNVHTPWPLPNIKLNAEISWRFNTDNSQLLQPIPILPLPDAVTGYIPAKATNILTNETFGVNYVTVEMSGDSITIPPPGNSNWAFDVPAGSLAEDPAVCKYYIYP